MVFLECGGRLLLADDKTVIRFKWHSQPSCLRITGLRGLAEHRILKISLARAARDLFPVLAFALVNGPGDGLGVVGAIQMPPRPLRHHAAQAPG